MASPGNPPNQVTPPPPTFDINKLFAPPLTSAAARHQIQLPYPPIPSSSYPPPTGAFSFPHHALPLHHYPLPTVAADSPPSSLFMERSLSYPTRPFHPPNPSPNPNANANQNAGAQLMALISGMPSTAPPESSAAPGIPLDGPARLPSSKAPKGRCLAGDSVVYDVDVRVSGEAQPQLEVTPITKYASDPQLVLGRQIAVNESYICYGLKQGNIRVLNVHTASRSLLRGHSERITDMAFFAEDVHLLASASKDRRVCVWKIFESPEGDDKVQISADIIIAIQVQGEESVHPRVCWHCHKQEILVVGVGRHILRIDSTKVGKGDPFSAEKPIQCPLDKFIDGVQLIGAHDGEITDLSMCQWMTSRLVSASTDGTIKIWANQKMQPLLVLRPHGGLPVHAATFVTSPHRPDHILLITAGPLNREVKVWTSASEASEEGWLLTSDIESWKCTQTLDLKSSAKSRTEDAFFNQVLVLPQVGLLLLANGKKNAIYVVHLEFGLNPTASRMDYLAEFTVTMPILSLTGITGTSPLGEHLIQIYCVQTQAIQQYALDLFLCVPPPLENFGLQKLDSSVSYDATSYEGSATTKMDMSSIDSAPNSSEKSFLSDRANVVTTTIDVAVTRDTSSVNVEAKTTAVEQAMNDSDIVCVASPSPSPSPLPPSPSLSTRQLSGFGSPNNLEPQVSFGGDSHCRARNELFVDRQVDTSIVDDDLSNGERKNPEDDRLSLHSPTVNFIHPTHLVTPSEILRAAPSFGPSDAVKDKTEEKGNIQNEIVDREVDIAEVGVKVVANGSMHKDGFSPEEPRNPIADNEKKLCSQASDLGVSIARECLTVSSESNAVDEAFEANAHVATVPPPSADELNVTSTYVCNEVLEPPATAIIVQTSTPAVKRKKHKGKNSQAMASSSSPSAFNSADSSNEALMNSGSPMDAFPQILSMRDKLNQVAAMQKELKKQMFSVVNAPVSKECSRLEAALTRSMEKTAKANSDALWARFQEENIKKEKLLQDQVQQIISVISTFMNKDIPAMLDRSLKKELPAIQTSIIRAVTPVIEKIVSSAITESFQKGVGDKAVNQLEKGICAKLEAVVARQILSQFQTSGKQALQDGLRSSFEASLLPGFEAACKTMFEQVNTAFQSGMAEHTSASIQHLDTANCSLALALRDAINSASSMSKTLSEELADGQRKLLSLAVAGANSSAINPLLSQLSSGPLANLHEKVELPVDPRKEVSRLISEHKYEEAFTRALQRSDVSIVSWLCSQVDLRSVLSMVPLPLSQGVLLSLLQQLACDINTDMPRKLSWMTDIVGALNPTDPSITMHVRPIFEQVYQILNHHRTLPSNNGPELSSIRLLMHVINSMLTTCK